MSIEAPHKTLKELLVAQEPRWLLRRGATTFGPVPELMLLKALLKGGVDQATPVRPVGQPEWRPIRAYPRLTQALAQLKLKLRELSKDASQASPAASSVPPPPQSSLRRKVSSRAPSAGECQNRLTPPPRPQRRAVGS